MNNLTCRCIVVTDVKKATAGPETQLSKQTAGTWFPIQKKILVLLPDESAGAWHCSLPRLNNADVQLKESECLILPGTAWLSNKHWLKREE